MAEKYQVLARKYRPQRFSEVIGQEAVVTTLKNGLRFDKIAHAYLFSGSRGVGKTTLARLFAKALNCQELTPDREPCSQCPSCLEIASGQSLDVIEIDGASNRGIDDIRQINETVGYAPSHGRYKIYIIDEVHMLTKEAFNALLKTLEEPPERAKFFFATTEAHKVLPTIISRCQRFDLGRILPTQITAKLEQIAADLQRGVEPEALHHIAAFSDGSLRDAESLFDQILCFAEGPVSADHVRQALGLVPQEHFFALDLAFSECRPAYAFELVDHLFQSGKDLAHFLEQLIEHYRLLTLSKTIGEQALPPPLAARYIQSARLYTQAQCLYLLEYLLTAETQLQRSASQRVSLEAILLHIIRSKNRVPVEVLVRRLSELEETLATAPKSATETVVPAAPRPVVEEKPAPAVAPKPATETVVPAAPRPVVEEKPAPAVAPKPATETVVPAAPRPVVEEKPAPAVAPKPATETVVPAAPRPVVEEKPTPAVAPKPATETIVPAAPRPVVEEKPAPAVAPKPAEEIVAPHPPVLKTVPFNPYKTPPQTTATAAKPQSHYDTVMRFAAVELEGSFKNN